MTITIDNDGNKWIGTWGGGLAKFDGVNWVVYNTSNSGLPENFVMTITIDNDGNKWIGTWGGGLAKFDGVNWVVYNTSNSGLPENQINAIYIDIYGNKWIGTNGRGVAVYREGGIIIVKVDDKTESTPLILLHQNYPNPFNSSTTIEFEVPQKAHVNLIIYDILGREIKTLVNKELEPGRYNLYFNASNLPSGIYLYTLKTPKFTKTNKMILIK